MTISYELLHELAHDASRTRRVLEAFPDEHLDWRPHAKSRTLIELAAHVVEIPGWALHRFVGDDFDLAAPPPKEPFEPRSRRDLHVGFGIYITDFNTTVRDEDDAWFEAPWTLRHGDRVLARMTRLDGLRKLVLDHVVHHRAQLAVYLRLLGVEIPQTYGPTAEHPEYIGEEDSTVGEPHFVAVDRQLIRTE